MVAQLEGAPPIHTAGPVSTADFGGGFQLVIVERRIYGGGWIFEASVHKSHGDAGWSELGRIWTLALLTALQWAMKLIPRLKTMPPLHLGRAPGAN